MIATTIDEKTKQVDDYLIFDGGISEGISTILNETLHKNPNIKTLVLNSRGGNPDEVLPIYKVIQDHKLNTWVPEGKVCMSACAEIFLAGKERFITGIVGFHNLWYNFTIGTPSDPHKLIKWLTLEYNIINPFSTLPDNPQG